MKYSIMFPCSYGRLWFVSHGEVCLWYIRLYIMFPYFSDKLCWHVSGTCCGFSIANTCIYVVGLTKLLYMYFGVYFLDKPESTGIAHIYVY